MMIGMDHFLNFLDDFFKFYVEGQPEYSMPYSLVSVVLLASSPNTVLTF
jgi:hypothetical protein